MDRRIGRNLRARRTSLSLTLGEVAGVCGISFQQVHKYERGANKISAEALWRIAKFLGAPLSSFYEDFDAETAASEAPVMGRQTAG